MSNLTFLQMLSATRELQELSQMEFAVALNFSSQYICDVEKGRRLPSVKFVTRVCEYLGRGPKGTREWHVAAARAHGWKV